MLARFRNKRLVGWHGQQVSIAALLPTYCLAGTFLHIFWARVLRQLESCTPLRSQRIPDHSNCNVVNQAEAQQDYTEH